MSYAIAHVIYGFDLTEARSEGSNKKPLPSWQNIVNHLVNRFNSEGDEELLGNADVGHEQVFEDKVGFDGAYTSGGDMNPFWFGVKVAQFDECNNIGFNELLESCKVTEKVMNKWEDIVSTFKKDDEKLYELFMLWLKEQGFSPEPTVRIVWGSS